MSVTASTRRACLKAAVAALVLSRLAWTAGRLSDALYRLATRQMRHAEALAVMATGACTVARDLREGA